MKAPKGWKRPFDDPIPLPRGRQIVTLEDSAAFILKLRKAERELPEWHAAGEALIMAAEGRGPIMHARIGVLRALNRTTQKAPADPPERARRSVRKFKILR